MQPAQGCRGAPDVAGSAGTAAGRSTVIKAVVTVGLLVAAALFAGVARQSWTATSQADQVVQLEAEGATMMHPMTTLLSALIAAQSAAVRGQAVDQGSLLAALQQLSEPNDEYGGHLQTRQRLADLSTQLKAAMSARPLGQTAYDTYSSLIDLAVDLIHEIGDTSHLIHDPDLDSYYLMDAALVRLPSAMIYSGRAADLVSLFGANMSAENRTRLGVARFTVASDAEQVGTGLTASVDSTARAELGGNIAQRLDGFRSAADAFSPPTMLMDLASDVDNIATLGDDATRVSTAAANLSHQLLFELQALLQTRADHFAEQRRVTVISTVAAGIVALVIIWLVVVRRTGRRAPADPDEPTTGARGIATVAPPTRRDMRLGVTGGEVPGGELAGVVARRTGHAR
jgi:hypothetical protein